MKPAEASAQPAPRRLGRGLIALFAISVGLAVASNYLAHPLLEMLRERFGVSTVVAGLLVTAAQAGYCLGLLLLLPLGDLLERRRLITVLSLLTAVLLAAAAAAPSIGFLMAAIALIGFTSAVAQILVPFAATLAPDAQRGSVVGVVMSGLLIGILTARAVSGAIAQIGGWRTVYVVAATAMLIVTALLRWRLPRYCGQSNLTYPRLLLSVLSIAREEPELRERALYGAAAFAAPISVLAPLAFLLSDDPYRFTEGQIGAVTLFGVVGALAATVSGRLFDRGWKDRLTLFGPLIMIASYFLLWLGHWSLLALIAGFIILDLGAQAVHITNQNVVYGLRPEARNRINSLYMTSCFVGITVGSSAAAVVYASFGWTGVCVLGACFGAVMLPVRAAALLSARRRARAVTALPHGPAD